MPGLICRLNCFSSKKSNRKRHSDSDGGGGRDDDGVRARKILLTGSPTSLSSTASTRPICSDIMTGASVSETSKGSSGLVARETSDTLSKGSSKYSSPLSSNLSSNLSPSLASSSKRGLVNDDNSIPTIDSDYKNVNSGNFSLSDAGGTVFSGSQQQSLSNFTQTAWPMSPLSPFGASTSVEGEPPVERRKFNDNYGYVSSNGRPSSHLIQSPHSKREEMLEIYAPPGLLGVVIDTPGGGSPVVHAIKDTCPIRREIYVGDKLVAVDDIDVRGMSAVDVSKLISKKSGQAKRKLTVIRSARGRDGVY